MPINGMLFDNRIPTAKAFRVGFQNALTDGILSGCDINFHSPYEFEISSGYVIVAGGIFKIDGSIVKNFSGQQTESYARVIAKFDPSKVSTPTEFAQIEIEIDYASAPKNFPALVHGDVNSTTAGQIYRAPLYIFQISDSNVFYRYESRPNIPFVDDAQARPDITIGADGYFRLDYPNTIPSDAHVISVSLVHWTEQECTFSIFPYANYVSGNGKETYAWIIGEAGKKIKGLRCRFWYI